MRRSSSNVTGKKTPQSRHQAGSSRRKGGSTGLIAAQGAGAGRGGPGRAGLRAGCAAYFLRGIWPLPSTSRGNFWWTLLYLNSPRNSDTTAGRLLCNSAPKCSGIERCPRPTPSQRGGWWSTTPGSPESSAICFSGMKGI